MAKKSRHVNIQDALQLNGDPEKIIEYYKNWSHSYDQDVTENYYGIDYICNLLDKHLKAQDDVTNSDTRRIVDVGCGTGLLGEPLRQLGYNQLDGIDLSPEMIARANQTGCYSAFYGGIDINLPVKPQLQSKYDAAICLGTFTPGHVVPQALNQLVSMTRKNGLVVLSTRIPYYDSTEYQRVNDELIESGVVRLIDQHMNAPYRDDGDAHYWVYNVLTT